MSCLVDFASLNWVSIVLAALATHMLSTLWHSVLFASIWEYYTAADKGVKKAKYMKMYYSFPLCLVVAVLRAVLCAAVVAAVVQQLPQSKQAKESTFIYVALLLSVFSVTARLSGVWAQRPPQLIILESLHDIVTAALGGYVLFYTKGYKVAF